MLIHVFASCFPPVISNMAGKSALISMILPAKKTATASSGDFPAALSFDYPLYIIIPIWKGTQQHPQQHPTIDISYDSSSHILILHHYTTIIPPLILYH